MKTIVIGIGNPVLRDDSAGIKVAQQFEGVVDTEILMTTDFSVIDKLVGYDRAIIIDGIRTGSEPGTVFELDIDEIQSSHGFSGTHNLSLATTLEIGFYLFGDEMPREIKIIGIEVEDTSNFGADCTPRVEAALPYAIEKVNDYLKNPSQT